MKFDSQYYFASVENGDIKFHTKRAFFERLFSVKGYATLIEKLRFSYSTCEIYNIENPLSSPQEIELDHVTYLQPGDSVIIVNNMYGGSALRTFWIEATIVYVKGSCIGIDVVLPAHITRRAEGLIVLKRTGYYDNLPIENLRKEIFLGGATFSFDVHCDHFKMRVKIRMLQREPYIDIQSNTVYLKECKLFHQGITIDTPLSLRELHLKNRMLRELKDSAPLDDVWLWKEGCRVGSQEGEWLIHHAPNIACIEIITKGKGFLWKSVVPTEKEKILINFEHYQAQRFRQVTSFTEYYDPQQFIEYKELSAPHYLKGEEKNHNFKLFLGKNLPAVPRLMLTPNGFRASHIWTEHADQTNIKTHRAAYFGDERIVRADQAVGGFVKYGHVVTKSIFYNNVRESKIWAKEFLETSYKTDPDFPDFLDQLDARGHEICLHTAAPDAQGLPEETHQAVKEISARYNSPTWIDHFYQGVQTCMSNKGATLDSPYSMLETWQVHNIHYFWHAASEDFMPKKKDGIDLLHNSSGDYTPTPLYWRIPSLPRRIISWAANECPLEYFKEETIEDLIKNRRISIHHHYYAFLESKFYSYNFIREDHEKRYVTTQEFNHVLSTMSAKQKEGELYITTINDLVPYWLALENIEIELCIPNSFILTNKGEQKIQGLSFVVRADKVTCSQTTFQSRSLDHGDLLVWLDMPAGAHYQFTIHNDVQSKKDGTPLNNNFIDDREKKNA